MWIPVPDSHLVPLLVQRQARIEWMDAADDDAACEARIAAVSAWLGRLSTEEREAMREFDRLVAEVRAGLNERAGVPDGAPVRGPSH